MEFSELHSRFLLVTYNIDSVYLSIPISQLIPPFSPLGVHVSVLYVCVSIPFC